MYQSGIHFSNKVCINNNQRLFIALSLSEEIKDFIDIYISEINHCFSGVNWEQKEKFHITLKFLGQVEEERCRLLTKNLDKVLKNIQSFEARIEKLTAFPNFKNPKVLVLKLLKNKQLDQIYNLVDIVYRTNGFPLEKRNFVPHITIGRAKKNFRILKQPEKIQKIKISFSEIAVIKSELKKTGSVFTILKSWNFG